MPRSLWKNSYVSFKQLQPFLKNRKIKFSNNSDRKDTLLPEFTSFEISDFKNNLFEIKDFRVGKKIGSFFRTKSYFIRKKKSK
jgi:ribosomal protein S19